MDCAAALGQLAAAITGLDGSPEAEKQMFLVALPNAFGPNMHKFQKEFAMMLRKGLEKARASAADAHIAANQRAKQAQTILETGQADVQAAKAAEEAARGFLNEKLVVLEAAQAAIKNEEAPCEEAEAKKALVAERRRRLEAARAEVESVKNGSFHMLREGGWEDEEVRDTCIDAVCSFLKNESAESVLLAALPRALRRRPAECGTFDKLAVDEALRFISERLDGLTAQLAEGENEFAELTAEHLGAWAILDVAREREQAAAEIADSARAALGAAAAEAKFAASTVIDHEAALAAVMSEVVLMESRVQLLDVGLAALAQLEAGDEVGKVSADAPMAVEKEGAAIGTEAVAVAA